MSGPRSSPSISRSSRGSNLTDFHPTRRCSSVDRLLHRRQSHSSFLPLQTSRALQSRHIHSKNRLSRPKRCLTPLNPFLKISVCGRELASLAGFRERPLFARNCRPFLHAVHLISRECLAGESRQQTIAFDREILVRRTAFRIAGEPRLHAIEVEHLVCPLMLGDDGAARFRTAQAAPGARRQTLSSAALPQPTENFRGSPFADVRAAVHVQHLPGHLAGFRRSRSLSFVCLPFPCCLQEDLRGCLTERRATGRVACVLTLGDRTRSRQFGVNNEARPCSSHSAARIVLAKPSSGQSSPGAPWAGV